MAGQETSSTLDQAVDDVLAELEQAQHAEAYRAASIERVRATIQLAAITARTQILGQIMAEAAATLGAAPLAGPALTAGLTAADAEATRLLAALGIDLEADRGG